jgi:AcrR family transcriptional regulator
VQYHFENKEGLLKGIFTRRLDSLEKRRAELLGLATQQGQVTDTRTLLEILLLPIADEKDSSDYCSYAAFLLGLRMFGDIASWNTGSGPAPVTRALDVYLRDSLPDLPGEVFRTRLLAGVSVFLMSVVDWDRQTAKGGEQRFVTRDEFLKQVMDFVVAGMIAPAGS